MNQDVEAASSLRNKCPACGLVNTATDEVCRRCGAPLSHLEFSSPEAELKPGPEPRDKSLGRTLLKRVLWVVSVTIVILVAFYASLLFTSDGLQAEQRQKVQAAIAILQQQGFSREAFVLNFLTTFRSSDN